MTDSVTNTGGVIIMVKKSEVRKLFETGEIKGYLQAETAALEIHVENMGNYTGAVFLNPEKQDAGKAIPVLNLDMIYEQVKDCEDIIEAGEKAALLVENFRKNTYVPDIDFSNLPEMMKNYDNISDRVHLSAVSPSYKNDITVIYNVNGMHFVPKLLLAQSGNESMLTTIPASVIKDMGLTEKEFYDKVSLNTKNVLKPEIRKMSDVLTGYDNDMPDYLKEDTGMIVVTSENKAKGAASLMLDDSVLSQVSEKYHGRNYFILPSSISEFLTMPVDDFLQENAETILGLTQMVEEVNETGVSPDEILSYDVYHYDSINHKLEKATDYCINKQIEIEKQNAPRADEELDVHIDDEKNNNIVK